MPARIPIKAAREFAQKYDCQQVIIMAWDSKFQHCITYGTSVEACDQAAQGGNRIKKALGWPENLMTEPSRVKALQKRVKELEEALEGYKERTL